ncbi:MAG: serine O-acetyltransferase [Rhodospirillaceae bacterium]|jgi:serine O-acetyltransferase|nr:serine O-acetyltransferase [Rhodospirillaceae bacterium]
MTFKSIRQEIASTMARDPAARSGLEVALLYPGFHAIVLHRAAHAAWRRGWRFLGRLVSQFARWMTGIEIHPGARIGRSLFIDHGMGVVIGETAEIGDNVTLYHGITLGGIAPAVDSAAQVDTKRHPTLEDDVIVGSGAQILGPLTVGRGARVGANAVVVRDVPAGVTVTGIPARMTVPRDRAEARGFMAYGTPSGDQPDPLINAIETLRAQVATLSARLEEIEAGAVPRSDAASERTDEEECDASSG